MRPPPPPIVWGANEITRRRARPRPTRAERVGQGIAVVATFFVSFTSPIFGFLFAAITVGVLAVQWRLRQLKRAQLLADCDIQHQAWKCGDDMTAFLGQYRPAAYSMGDGIGSLVVHDGTLGAVNAFPKAAA